MAQNRKSRTIFSRLVSVACDWLFPPRCPICDGILDAGEMIHKSCRSLLFPVRGSVCMKCGRLISSEQGEYCGECRRKKHSFIQAKGLFAYKGEIRKSMYRFKYQNRREYAGFYAEYARMQYGKWIADRQIDCIVPVPMYRKKARVRGYNQAKCFADALACQMHLPSENKLIVRKINTEALKLMNENQRKMALKGAFAVRKEELERIGYRRILLVDDIYTTGSTADEIAGMLLETDPTLMVYVMTICSPAVTVQTAGDHSADCLRKNKIHV